MNHRHVALVGSTASGKSALAMELARRLPNMELVSIDSMQVYRGMDIGTAKPSSQEQSEIRHHLLDLVDPWEEFSLSQFQKAAGMAIDDIERRGKRAILVGGTGLYVRAVVDKLEIPGQWPHVRAELEDEPRTDVLHQRLGQLDPQAAARMEPTNRRRVLRALEVTLGSGRPFSSFGPGLNAYPPTNVRLLGIGLSRPMVWQRIQQRVDSMVQGGWIDEVYGLRGLALPLSKTAAQALGYRELLAHVDGSLSLDEAMSQTVRRTRTFARRQRVWFRRDPRITWHVAANDDPRSTLAPLLRDCEQWLSSEVSSERQGGEATA